MLKFPITVGLAAPKIDSGVGGEGGEEGGRGARKD